MTHTAPMTDPLAPRTEFRPLRAALLEGVEQTLTLLVRLHPAPRPQKTERPPLNLSLVLDRSGSMAGEPLEMAKAAVLAAARQLRPADRLSVVSFDTGVRVELTSTPVGQLQGLETLISRIESGGSTDLHSGWLAGAEQVALHLNPAALNRVILLSDGQANAGIIDPREIFRQVSGLRERGVSTTAMGFGRGYDEELLIGMATAGDGEFQHIESASQLPTFFEAELNDLGRTTGRQVSLGLEPNSKMGFAVKGVLNELPLNELGRLMLPSLLDGQPLEVVAQIHIPALPEGTVGVLRARVAWTDGQGRRKSTRVQLDLPVVSRARYEAEVEDPEVQEAAALQQVARHQREAALALRQGDRAGSLAALSSARDAGLAAPADSAAMQAVSEQIEAMYSDVQAGADDELNIKRGRAASRRASGGRKDGLN